MDAARTGGPDNIVSSYKVAQWFYPGLVPISEDQRIEKEYFQRFQGFTKRLSSYNTNA
jgi:hypothetical protein